MLYDMMKRMYNKIYKGFYSPAVGKNPTLLLMFSVFLTS